MVSSCALFSVRRESPSLDEFGATNLASAGQWPVVAMTKGRHVADGATNGEFQVMFSEHMVSKMLSHLTALSAKYPNEPVKHTQLRSIPGILMDSSSENNSKCQNIPKKCKTSEICFAAKFEPTGNGLTANFWEWCLSPPNLIVAELSSVTICHSMKYWLDLV